MTEAYAIGQTICDDYVVWLPLGEGGMGQVYLVEHASTGDLRAAKVMKTRDGAIGDDLAARLRAAVGSRCGGEGQDTEKRCQTGLDHSRLHVLDVEAKSSRYFHGHSDRIGFFWCRPDNYRVHEY